MKLRRLWIRMAALLMALGISAVPALAETVPADSQETYAYSYTWRVTDDRGPGWADLCLEAEVLHDRDTGQWQLLDTSLRPVRGFCLSRGANRELPMSAYLVTGGENPRLKLKCDTSLEYQYGPFSGTQELKQEYTFLLDEPGEVLAPGVPGEGEMDFRCWLSLALGVLMRLALLFLVWLIWRRYKKRLDSVQPMETPES